MEPRAARILAFVRAAAIPAVMAIAQAQPKSLAPDCNQAAPEAIATVSLPGHPFSTLATHDGCWLFVSLTSDDPKTNGIAVLRRTGGTITLERVYPIEGRPGRDAMRPGPGGMVMTHDDQLLIAANDDHIYFLNVEALILGKKNPVLGRINDYEPDTRSMIERGDRGSVAPPGSVYVNVAKDDTHLFVSDEFAATITVIDLKRARSSNYDRSSIVGKIPVGRAPVALTFSPDERWLYSTSGMASSEWSWPAACAPVGNVRVPVPEGAVLVVDVRKSLTDPAHAVVAKAAAGCTPVRLAISKSGDTLWASARVSNLVIAFDTSKLLHDPLNARIGSVRVGAAPAGLALLPDGKHLLVANSNKWGDNPMSPQKVAVIDVDKVQSGKPAIVGNIPAGAAPREFGQSPDGQTIFLANYLSNTLQIIDVRKLP